MENIKIKSNFLPQTPAGPLPPFKKRRRNFLPLILLILVLLGLGGGGYYWMKNRNVVFTAGDATKKTTGDTEADETATLVAKVGKLLVLPEGETPTIATVSDPEKLRGEAFFAKAKAGFKVLIYSQAKKAILYDPVANIIVEVAPLNIEADKN